MPLMSRNFSWTHCWHASIIDSLVTLWQLLILRRFKLPQYTPIFSTDMDENCRHPEISRLVKLGPCVVSRQLRPSSWIMLQPLRLIDSIRLNDSAISLSVWLLSRVQLRSRLVTFGQRMDACRAKLSPESEPLEQRLRLSTRSSSPMVLNMSAMANRLKLPLHWTMLSSVGRRLAIQRSQSSHTLYWYFMLTTRPKKVFVHNLY